MSDIHLSGFLFNASGAAVNGATVEAFAKNTVTETGGTPVTNGSTTTNSSGYYTMTVTSDNEHDVRITSGNSVRWRRFDDRLQVEEIEVSTLNIREGATAQVYTIAPGSISADRTLTLPAATGNDTLASLGLAQTFSAAQTFTGAVTVGSDGSGADVIFYSGTAGDNLTWDASEELLTITGTNGATALNVADGNVTIADNLTVSGNLTVTGTTTSVCSTTINVTNAFIFEGATADAHETTLGIIDPTADATINLPAMSAGTYYLPVMSAASTTAVASTPAELNLLDGSAKSTSSITICDADAFIVIDGTTTKQIPASDITTYVGAGTMSSFQLEDDDGTEVAISNAKEVKIIGSGVTTNWTDTDNGTDGDPYDLTITVDAAQTGITSVYNASLKVGRDAGNLIDFATTDNKLIFRVECVNEVELVQNALSPVTSDGVALGTGSLMWSDAFLASGAVVNFNNGDVTLTHSACTLTVAGGTLAAGAVSTTGALTVGVDDTGHDVKFFGAAAGAFMLYDQSCDQLEIRGASADATTSTGKLLLSTSLTNVNANDVIGSINFQAPVEAGGTDAITIAAGIRAVAQATFTCAVNATDLIFYTGHSEAATEKFRFTSQGEIGVGGANYGTDGQVLTSGGAGAAAAWEDAGGGGVVSGGTDNAVLRADGTGGSTSQGSAVIINDSGDITVGDGAACAPSYGFTCQTEVGFYRASSDSIGFVGNGSAKMRAIMPGGCAMFAINDCSNGKMACGITINQGTNDDEALALKSSDVAHCITGVAETDTYGQFRKHQAPAGGLEIVGLSDADSSALGALALRGILGEAASTTKSTSGYGIIRLISVVKSGTGYTSPGSNANLLDIEENGDVVRFIFDVEGSAHADVGTSTYDDYNDVELLRGFLATTCDKYKQNYQDRFGQDLMYNQQWYEDNKLIGKCSIHYETLECGRVQQRAMVNMTGLTMLHHSTIIQLADNLNARIDGIETQLKALTEGK